MTETQFRGVAAPESVVLDPPVLYPGTPVVLLSSLNPDGSPNLMPMSSAWVIGKTALLGLGRTGQTFENLRRSPECVLNYACEDLWPHVERLAPLTAVDPVPPSRASQFRTERDKFGAAGLTPVPGEVVSAPRVAESPIQVECRVVSTRVAEESIVGVVEAQVLRVHVHPELAAADGRHVVVDAWRPLFYAFRRYLGRGPQLAKSFRAND
ncbi:NADH-FMN oxidoreductase RutF, flavin reductase (DIM6/NTAB) family [Streptoalloteichus tenebrarius]|uniref:NADH-FMN oxidoreductase RutF, flavin reductase (DIM6/NTAB) family n=1 Tax=Streptoalloteichus tenebrarius (strain ATCC 17920 / DSM 40477 / JCM 4838 / CBS 697.72 / NBRC 16177 / NCIMB 11028 / NRRL B-12390 / A12253. 1 / ISP 5477) TaxID=1933 RepID=A0ABT1HTN2_STRSD|nr:flavin reductase family protein [Streptoalloteichus tenebrarius]MCP2258887.1 NADH-FMN oxidoreductase RutF, flavin reductase (DIM6/NTAB) family [Streptoalloteichus tenebrarius]BFE99428.1 flavin reductase family protein [Streptoalloteichus tenebrarius]